MAFNDLLLLANDDVSKPLNHLINERFDSLMDGFQYVSSDNVLRVILQDYTVQKDDEATPLDKTMKHSGSLSVNTWVTTDYYLDLKIYINERLTTDLRYQHGTFSTVFSFNKGDVVKIVVRGRNGKATINYMHICGTLTFNDW